MSYKDLIKQATQNPDSMVCVRISDLVECNRQMFEMMRAEMFSAVRSLHQEKMMRMGEVCDYLGVDRSTLHRWNKQGILCAVRIGGKVYYRTEDVLEVSKKPKS